MFSDRGYNFRNGKQSSLHSERAVSGSIERGHYFNSSANPKRMETKVIFSILSALGLTSYVGAIILNIGNWKADVLWFIACMFGVVKFIRYCLKTWQDYRRTEIEIKLKRKEADE